MPVINLPQMDRRCFQLFLVLSQIHWNDAGGRGAASCSIVRQHLVAQQTSFLKFSLVSYFLKSECISIIDRPTSGHCLLIANYFMLFVFIVKDKSPTFVVEAHKKNGFNRDWWIHELRWPIGESMRKQLNLVNPVLSYQWEFMRSVQKMARIYLDNFFN